MCSILASLSSAALGVRLYPPVIRLRHLFWIFSSCCRLAFICLPFCPVCHACAPYTIAGLTIAVYSSLVLIKQGPQVDAAIRERASKAAVPFPTATFVCSFQFIQPYPQHSELRFWLDFF